MPPFFRSSSFRMIISTFILLTACTADSEILEDDIYADEIVESANQSENSEESDSSSDSSADSDEGDAESPSPPPNQKDPDYPDIQTAMATSTIWEPGEIFTVGGLQGGEFIYDHTDNTSTSDGGTIFINSVQGYRFKRIWNEDGIVKGEWFGMVPGNMSYNNHQALSMAVQAHRDGIVSEIQLQAGEIYNFDNTIDFWEYVDGLTLSTFGNGRATLYSDNLDNIWRETQPCKNMFFKSIKFESTWTGPVPNENEAALQFFYNTNMSGIYIEDCEYTCPNIKANGLKFFANDNLEITDVSVRNSYFHHTGRMGCESVTGISQGRPVRNFVFEGNTFESPGLIGNGMGVSIDGWSQNITIRNNTFINCSNTGIEFIGVFDGFIIGNQHTGLGSAIHIVNGSGVLNKDILIQDNEAVVTDGNIVIQAENIISENNSFVSDQRFYLENCINYTSTNDSYSIRGYNEAFGQATSLWQMTSDSSLEFNNCVIRALNNVPVSNSSISLNCSDVYILSSGSFGNSGNYINQDVSVYLNEVFVTEYADTGVDCGLKGPTTQ